MNSFLLPALHILFGLITQLMILAISCQSYSQCGILMVMCSKCGHLAAHLPLLSQNDLMTIGCASSSLTHLSQPAYLCPFGHLPSTVPAVLHLITPAGLHCLLPLAVDEEDLCSQVLCKTAAGHMRLQEGCIWPPAASWRQWAVVECTVVKRTKIRGNKRVGEVEVEVRVAGQEKHGA